MQYSHLLPPAPRALELGDFLGEGGGGLHKQEIKPQRRKISLGRFEESYLNRYFFYLLAGLCVHPSVPILPPSSSNMGRKSQDTLGDTGKQGIK